MEIAVQYVCHREWCGFGPSRPMRTVPIEQESRASRNARSVAGMQAGKSNDAVIAWPPATRRRDAVASGGPPLLFRARIADYLRQRTSALRPALFAANCARPISL